jgi:hypothetical protein
VTLGDGLDELEEGVPDVARPVDERVLPDHITQSGGSNVENHKDELPLLAASENTMKLDHSRLVRDGFMRFEFVTESSVPLGPGSVVPHTLDRVVDRGLLRGGRVERLVDVGRATRAQKRNKLEETVVNEGAREIG